MLFGGGVSARLTAQPLKISLVLKTRTCISSYHASLTNVVGSLDERPSSRQRITASFLIVVGAGIAEAAGRFLPRRLVVGLRRLLKQGDLVRAAGIQLDSSPPWALAVIVGVDFML